MVKQYLQSVSLAFALALIVATCQAEVITGKVVGVHDGDTITVLDTSRTEHKVRLNGIDAPERVQNFGQTSKRNLSNLVFGKMVSVEWTKRDRYGRIVGTLLLDGRDINLEQLRAGLAWYYRDYERDVAPARRAAYAEAEANAQALRGGLWSVPNPQPPWEFRRTGVATQKKIDERPAVGLTGRQIPTGMTVGNYKSKIYHTPNCPDYAKVAEQNWVLFESEQDAIKAGFRKARNCPASQSLSLPQRQMFGISLRPSSLKLLAEVERLYKTTVKGTEADDFPSNKFGESKIDQQGNPIIAINPTRGRTERNIVHELYHLKLMAQGFPVLMGRAVDVRPSPEMIQVFEAYTNALNDVIQHSIFYPDMTEMGLSPSVDLTLDFERDIKNGRFQTTDEPDRKGLSYEYLKARIELNDSQLLNRIEKWFQQKGWNESLKVGRQLERAIKDVNPHTAEESIGVLIYCLNILLKGEYKFEFEGWDKEMRGEFARAIAIIRILPGS